MKSKLGAMPLCVSPSRHNLLSALVMANAGATVWNNNIAGTNRDLIEQTAKGRFREDLLARLAAKARRQSTIRIVSNGC